MKATISYDQDKAAVISGASLLVYPSHYEGFGIPPIEALACGVPIIAADNSSLPEAVGKAGLLIDVEEDDLLAKTIQEALNNIDELAVKARTEGPAQAKQFSWKNSAQVFLETIKDIQ
jgi:glycosyltransferase involved in cell wall biosynthesis